MKKRFILILLLFPPLTSSYAAIYEQNNNSGGAIFSDTPTDDAQPVTLPRGNSSISSPPNSSSASATQPSAAPSSKTRQPYTEFTLTAPSDQETFQNQRDIPVKFNLVPALQEGDKIQLFLDGSPVGDPSGDSSQLVIHQIERGQHQISATLNDSAGHMLLKTGGVTIFIHYSAIPTGSGAIKTNL